MNPIEIYWISHLWRKNLGANHSMVSTNKYSMNRKGIFKITTITPAIPFLSGWICSHWFIISLGLICQHSEDTYLIFWNSERDQPPNNLFHLSFRTATHDERRFMLNEYICHCLWCFDYMNMTQMMFFFSLNTMLHTYA